MNKPQLFLASIAVVSLSCLGPTSRVVGQGSPNDNPDFTRGDVIPNGATHDWNLGPTGARGWIFSNKMETSEARQIYITKVDEGSPAEGIVRKASVILCLGRSLDLPKKCRRQLV